MGREIFTFRVFLCRSKGGVDAYAPEAAELVGAKPLHLAGARPFGRLKAPLGLSLLRCARKRELSLDVLGEGQAILPGVFQQELAELLLRNRRFQIILAPADIKITA